MTQQRKPSRSSQGPRRSEKSHEAILDAAEQLLSEGGPNALTFEAVARKAKAGKPTLYKWWPNKFSLIFEVYNRTKLRSLYIPDSGNFKDDLMVFTQELWKYWRETNSGATFVALLIEAQRSQETQNVLASQFSDFSEGPFATFFERAAVRKEISDVVNVIELRKAYVAMNWFHLLCGRLNEEEIEPAITILLESVIVKNKN